MRLPFGLTLDKTTFCLILGFFVLNIHALNNSELPVSWKILILSFASFRGVLVGWASLGLELIDGEKELTEELEGNQ